MGEIITMRSRLKRVLRIAKNFRDELKQTKKKSGARKRHLRELNKKIILYTALVDASLSDAARFKAEADLWQERYFNLLDKQDGSN